MSNDPFSVFPTGPSVDKFLKKMKPYSSEAIKQAFANEYAAATPCSDAQIPLSNRFSGKQAAIERIAKEVAKQAFLDTETFWRHSIGYLSQMSAFDSREEESDEPIYLCSNNEIIIGHPKAGFNFPRSVKMENLGMQPIPGGSHTDFLKALVPFLKRDYNELLNEKFNAHIPQHISCTAYVEHSYFVSLKRRDDTVEGIVMNLSCRCNPTKSRSSLESW